MSDIPASQFRLKTLLLIITGVSIVFGLWRAESLLIAYELIPIVAFVLVRKEKRWPAAVVAMLVMVVSLAMHLAVEQNAFRSYDPWHDLGEAAMYASILGIISIPFWLGPILLWGTVSQWVRRPGDPHSVYLPVKVGDEDANPYQFRLRTLFTCMTGCAVLFFILRNGGLPLIYFLVYGFAPIFVFGMATPRARFTLTYATMIVLVIGNISYLTLATGWPRGATTAIFGGILWFPVWSIPILFWHHLTTPTQLALDNPKQDAEADDPTETLCEQRGG